MNTLHLFTNWLVISNISRITYFLFVTDNLSPCAVFSILVSTHTNDRLFWKVGIKIGDHTCRRPSNNCLINIPLISFNVACLECHKKKFVTYSPLIIPMMPHSESYMNGGTVTFISNDRCPASCQTTAQMTMLSIYSKWH